ncbi:MAG: restriction endonuclease [Bacteroidetes bacterium]|nr:MAG: restriction endonuclease [Bacteroidota bacterium]REK00419.1 MAG: restriction endonuclease [Bacteroidota bacterium]REK05074.1 MAG: restriction endonuclease [Bacteroidota bacterium]REK35537.1 MAG: restriction endonuclease [Bacteroidota bacterium]REK51639.1 MAG: restriction endonuclease [Bacteroidota bacterium]
MSNELITINPGLLAVIQGHDSALLPFVRELLVLECHIAGTSYLDLEEIEPKLKEGDKFLLIREPENKHDEFAVAIFTQEKEKLGFLPRDRNETIARLLDAGKMIFASMVKKEMMNDWLKLSIRVFYVDR